MRTNHTRWSRRCKQRRHWQAKYRFMGGDTAAPPWTVDAIMAKRALAVTRQRRGR